MTRDEIRTRAADIIEPHITGDFKRRDRAEGVAEELDDANLLAGGCSYFDARERVVNQLQCRMSWPTAEQVAAELAAADLLTT
jgi:hypothetical protein